MSFIKIKASGRLSHDSCLKDCFTCYGLFGLNNYFSFVRIISLNKNNDALFGKRNKCLEWCSIILWHWLVVLDGFQEYLGKIHLSVWRFLMISLKDTKAAISAGERKGAWLLMKQINSSKERGAYSLLLHCCKCDPRMKKQVFLVCHS